MTFALAHFSDLHLGPLPQGAVLQRFRAKRLLGGISWHLRRKKLHLPAVASALRQDIWAAAVDHIAFTGDGTNLASPLEFPPLLHWMQETASPEHMSYVPGNHDAYVKAPLAKTLGLLQAYMQGDMRGGPAFPYVRLRRNVALIGLNSAIPRGFFSAEGRLGRAQLAALQERLVELKTKGFYRLLMIHHPPMHGYTKRLRSLIDAPELTELLSTSGAELVIHGHNHKRQLHFIPTAEGRIPVVGVASASSGSQSHPAEWNHYAITRQAGRWLTQVTIRQWQASHGQFHTAAEFDLDGQA